MTLAGTWPSINTANYVRDMCPRISAEMYSLPLLTVHFTWRPSFLALHGRVQNKSPQYSGEVDLSKGLIPLD